MKKIYEKKLSLPYYLTDHNSSLKTSSILRLLTNLSLEQSRDLIKAGNQEKKDIWVIYRWNIEIIDLPKSHENIKISTWAVSFKSFYAYRNFEISRRNKILVKAKSQWLLLNKSKGKILRIPKKYGQMLGSSSDEIITDEKIIYICQEDIDYKKSKKVNINHLDINQHVNNAIYLDWIISAIDPSIWDEKQISYIDIVYKKELKINDDLEILIKNDLGRFVCNINKDNKLHTYIELGIKDKK